MRVTIEIDEKSGSTAITPSTASAGTGSSGADTASSASAPSPPPEVMAIAAATGALNGGPAPGASGTTDSGPHPFHSRGAAVSDATHAAAVSGGEAAKA
jgi:hypothetical protein